MVLVVGANGMLGKDLMTTLSDGPRGVDIEEIDITSYDSVRTVLVTLKPAVVVNAAAYTDVDGCETGRETAFAVNGHGVGHLARVTTDIGAKLVHISTDYVFDGGKGTPYLEDDPTNPLSVYGASKLLGEENARLNPDHLVVRTQWLYGRHGRNFVETMLKLAAERTELSVVDDQIGSPTLTVDLAEAIRALVKAGCRGTYHAANAGFCSWNGFARTIFSEAGIAMVVKPMTTTELNRPAPRPLYSTLDCGKLIRDAGYHPRPWQDALKQYLTLR
jgi:dTDP-4-dehydrorhamnose reductase